MALSRRAVLEPMTASLAAILLGAGAKGKRYALPNVRIMIHQPLGGVEGQASGRRRLCTPECTAINFEHLNLPILLHPNN